MIISQHSKFSLAVRTAIICNILLIYFPAPNSDGVFATTSSAYVDTLVTYDTDNNYTTSNLNADIPDLPVLYYPFDENTTAYFPNANYGIGYHAVRTALQYSIDVVLNASYGGDNAYIYPIASGTVIESKYSKSFGNVVYISHADSLGPGFVSIYGHMRDFPKVGKDDPVTVDTWLGIQGKTGYGIPKPNIHLHVSLVYCAPPLLPTEALQDAGGKCLPVRMEPLIGRYVDEKFNWWFPSTATTRGIGTYHADGNRSISPDLLNDKTSPPYDRVQWNLGTTQPNAPHNPLFPGQPIVFDVHYEDDDAGVGIGEIRLTANYDGWHPNPEGAWRIVARCRPDESTDCNLTDWRYEWDWATDIKPNFSYTPIPVPWMAGVQKTLANVGPKSLCISFDVFDRAGNPRYSPQGGVLCGFNIMSSVSIDASLEDSEPRLIYVDGGSLFPSAYDASFIVDVTIPDGTIVSPVQSLTKVWRMKNTGSLAWGAGTQLVFVGGNQMGAPGAVDIPAASPGQEVDLSVSITAPDVAGDHIGYWRLRNPQGTFFGPTLWVKINVRSSNTGGGHITIFDVSPASPSSATSIHLVGRITLFPEFRSMRFIAGGEPFEMINVKLVGDQYEISTDWNVASLPRGDYTIAFEVATKSDTGWSSPERRIRTYTLTGTPVPTNRPPDRPILQSPYNWYLKDAAGSAASVQLCVQPVSDPDGDPVSYYFEVTSGAGTILSGWQSSNCWEHTFDPEGYSWRVKSGDGAAESDWSAETWHFTVAKGGVYIGDITFYNRNTDDTHICVPVTYDGIQGPSVYAWINTATDGSENGEWRLLDHYGPSAPPDCTDSNVHGFWIRSLRYETGIHKIRVNAYKPDSGANATQTTAYDIPYLRPSMPNLIAPASNDENGTWWNTLPITFEWTPGLRTDSQLLRVSASSDIWNDPSPLVNATLSGTENSHTYSFSQDYNALYWGVRATNSEGSADSYGTIWFGIDRVKPTCAVQALPAVYYDNVFQVIWQGIDNAAGVRSYDVQYLDSEHGTWNDWLLGVPDTKTYEAFNGKPGHSYDFRCRTTDRAGNTGVYPDTADTSIKIDPTMRPPAPWWDPEYATKRTILVVNNVTNVALPVGYPVKVRFSSTTTPSAAEIYNASLSSPKCDDLRVVYNDTTQLQRVVKVCSSTEIEIWFRTQVSIPAGASNSDAHLYYGNPSPGAPPAETVEVFYPTRDEFTRGLWYLDGNTTDFSSFSNHGEWLGGGSWASGKWDQALAMSGDYQYQGGVRVVSAVMRLYTFTIEAYVKRARADTYCGGAFVSQGNANEQRERWRAAIEGNQLSLQIWDGGTVTSNWNTIPIDTAWHHVAMSYDHNTGEVRMYVDGNHIHTGNVTPSSLVFGDVTFWMGSMWPFVGGEIQTFCGTVDGVRFSSAVRTSFPHGTYTSITAEPGTEIGAAIYPPVTGNVDLQVLELSTYPNADGGILTQAVLRNDGTLPTQNGFFNDLYLNAVPSGTGNYTGSVHFWINEPIAAGATVTLTSVITDVAGLVHQVMSDVPYTEITGTLRVLVDSSGALSESDENNNIDTGGTEVCIATGDVFENDDTVAEAKVLLLDQTQTRNISKLDDQDWATFTAEAEKTYIVTTGDLGLAADTYLYLYDTDGTTLLAANDDDGNSLASRIEWAAPADGTYYILVKHWNPNVSGCGTGYTLNLTEARPFYNIYLPLTLRAYMPPAPVYTLKLTALSGDGEIGNLACADYDACRNTITGNYLLLNTYPQATIATSVYSGVYDVKRVFLSFDPSALRQDAEIVTATLSFYAGPHQHGSTRIVIVPSVHETELRPIDFTNPLIGIIGGVAEPGPDQWVHVPLTDLMLSWIGLDETTGFALVHELDYYGTQPTELNDLVVSLSESEGYEPYLTIQYKSATE